MDAVIRPGRTDDRDVIAAFTTDTFSWGDYIADVFDGWLADPNAETAVAEVDGKAVGMARVAMVSDVEAWAQGARIHPDHRRRGLGTELSRYLWSWAHDQHAARAQVSAMGFRPAGEWFMAERAVGEASPVPEGNGGRRVPPPERLRPAHVSEVEPAFLSWSGGSLVRAARGLFPHKGWVWRRLHADDLIAAADRRALWAGRPGWAIAEVVDELFRVGWLETAPSDARAMVKGLVDIAAGSGTVKMRVMAPQIDWLQREFRRAGAEIHPMTIWALSLEG
jgi:GNAT superfamily N-acetyltransferase